MLSSRIQQQFDLDGKVAIVTGGARGIGKGIATILAGAGANVMLADVNMEGANETVKEIRAAGGKAAAVRADVTVVADASKLVEATVKEFGRLDILVNNAGYSQIVPFLDVTEALYDRTLDINLKGMFFCSQAAAREMIREGKGGKIINIASLAAYLPTNPQTHYSASKGGAVSLTKAMARELVSHGILVNAVVPGGVNTPGGLETLDELVRIRGPLSEEETEAVLLSFVPKILVNRVAEPEEIGNVVLFLASPASNYVVGTVIVVDGGVLLA
jgi:2-dehydro-3-deoxy-D-gluconate 5-dehydrogenase